MEVAVGYIRLMCSPVWQYVIPGTILWRSGTRHGFVPFVAACKLRIYADHDTSVVESFVVNEVANRKTDA